MDFLKKHYEKVLLGVVLLGLAAAVAVLPFKISSDRQALEEATQKRIPKTVKPLPNLDMAKYEGTLKRVSAPVVLDLASPHRLFNSTPWQKAVDGHLIKVEAGNIGPQAVAVTKATKLYTIITLDKVVTLDTGTRYVVGVRKEAAPEGKREKKETYSKVNDKNENFTLRDVKGPTDESAQLILELTDTGERAVVSTNQPFRRVDGYMVDLKYDPEKKHWTNRRVNSQPPLSFNGEDYNIVAITQNEVVLSAKSNQKKWTVKYGPPP